MNVLAGDVNANKAVNAADVGLTKSFLGSAAKATNFRPDVNASGTINAAEVRYCETKPRRGRTLIVSGWRKIKMMISHAICPGSASVLVGHRTDSAVAR